MKQLMGMVIIAGFLVVTADLEAAQRRSDRARAKDAPALQAVLAAGPQLLAVADYAPPPPAPAIDAVPPGPMPPVAGSLPPTAMPLPEAARPGMVGPMAAGGPPLPLAPAVALYPCVKYKDLRHVAPCAVPMCVAVRDPCERPHHERCSCGQPKCVLVEICVPPCGTPKISCRHDGSKVRYDYGKYAVNITSRHGVVVVNYDR
jgi:hypothetical protein